MQLSPAKVSFIEFMLQCGVLRFGEFTTKSGRLSPYFLNTGKYTKGSQLVQLGAYYADLIFEHYGNEVTNLFGPAYKGIPLVVAASTQLSLKHGCDISITFNRKEVKDHGEGGSLVGNTYAEEGPHKIVLVEDVTTAGTSIRETMPILAAKENVEVIGLVVSVDRMERGKSEKSALRELEETYGFKTTPIVSLKDLLLFLENRRDENRAVVDNEQIKKMYDYYEKWGGQ